ncbi:MAG: glycoside hydrolase family 16 protein [Bacteroidota bacterium]
MKVSILILVIFPFWVCSACGDEESPPPLPSVANADTVISEPSQPEVINYDEWNLVWSDEFEEPSIDSEKWSLQIGNGCPNLCGWGNNELQYYTDREQNAFIEDGQLFIRAAREQYEGFAYTSARMISKDKGDFRFGRVEARARLPEGQGIWPAIWMLPTDEVYGSWAASGEIDIMEMVGHEPNTIHGTVHYNQWPNNKYQGGDYPAIVDLSEEFHTYAITWEKDSIYWWFDDTNYFSIHEGQLSQAEQYPFNEKFHLILNLAVGGNWPGSPDGTTNFPQQLAIDYIRVYQRK